LQTTPVIAIVDDDEAVRISLSSFVRSMGWRARLYDSAEAFLASGQATDTACLISDIRMPGMSGVEMHEQLIAQRIAPPTIFISAYPSAAMRARVDANGALALLEKPYSADAMAQWLSIAVEGKRD
jgi:FixJ family two-component response regulator